MYEKQTQSHKYRNMDKLYGKLFKADELYEQIYSKHFRTEYAGKPTKRYLKLMKEIEKSELSTYEVHTFCAKHNPAK